MATFERLVARLCEGLAVLGAGALLAIAAFTLADIVGRYAFGRPIVGYVDVAALATAVAVSSFFPILILRQGNIALDFIGRAAGPRTGRALDLFGALVTLGFFTAMAWQYARYAADAVASAERMPVMRWATGPWWWLVTGFIGLTVLASLIALLQTARGEGKAQT